jgi:hypothetical protein
MQVKDLLKLPFHFVLGVVMAVCSTTGYGVQTVRIATQPFPEYLCSSSSSSNSGTQQLPQALDDVMVTNAVLLESLAARHGIPLVSLGSSSDPQHLQVIPRIITATSSTSCTFALPQDPDWLLVRSVAEVIMDIAAATGVCVCVSAGLCR